MMRKAPVLILTFVFAATCFVACQKQEFETDEAAIRALVKGDPAHFTSGTAGDSTENAQLAEDTTRGKWWRGPQTHDSAATIDVEVVGDSAWVGWHQHNYGEIFHWIYTSDTTLVKWTKTLQEVTQINGIFKREGSDTAAYRGWKLQRISLAFGQSETTNTVRIDSLKIHSSLRDILIVDPVATYYHVDSLVTFTPGEKLDITLYTNATDGYGWLHAFWGTAFVRVAFDDAGSGVFTGTWNAQMIPGFRFAIFDLMTRGTLMDRAAPYDYNGWLLPYRIQTAK
jgi:hypothetical protein